jgi:hypothetical protein
MATKKDLILEEELMDEIDEITTRIEKKQQEFLGYQEKNSILTEQLLKMRTKSKTLEKEIQIFK